MSPTFPQYLFSARLFFKRRVHSFSRRLTSELLPLVFFFFVCVLCCFSFSPLFFLLFIRASLRAGSKFAEPPSLCGAGRLTVLPLVFLERSPHSGSSFLRLLLGPPPGRPFPSFFVGAFYPHVCTFDGTCLLEGIRSSRLGPTTPNFFEGFLSSPSFLMPPGSILRDVYPPFSSLASTSNGFSTCTFLVVPLPAVCS